MSDPVTAARYRAGDGTEHQVLVQRAPEGHWRILDAVEDKATVVDALTGPDDGLDQAAALARDYAAEQHADHEGDRLDHLPEPPPEVGEEPAWAA